jgi:hypothetical protein
MGRRGVWDEEDGEVGGKKMEGQKRTEVNGTYLMGQMGWVM